MPIPVPPLDELLFKRPVPGTGFRIQDDQQYWDQGNWDEPGRHWDGELWFAVELAVPPAEGQTVWAASEDDPFGDEWAADESDPDGGVWGAPWWEDITPWMREITWTRGRSPGSDLGQGEVGTMQITIDNRSGRFVPWSDDPFTLPAYMGAGTLARVVVYDPVSLATTEPTSRYYDDGYWRALFTGPTESWTESSRGVGADRNVTITATDTLVYLSRLNSPPLAGVPEQGPRLRVNQLTTNYLLPIQCLFPYPETSPALLVTTDSAGNALQNVYRAAAQGDAVFYGAGNGRAVYVPYGDGRIDLWGARVILSDKPTGFEDRAGTLFIHVPYVADSLAIANDTDGVVNKVILAAPGGTAYTFDSAVIDKPWSESEWTYRRTDMQWNAATAAAAAAWLADRLLDKGAATIRPATLRLNANTSRTHLAWLLEMDLYRLLRVEQGNVHFTGPVVSRITHAIRPGFGKGDTDRELVWTCDVELDISRFSTFDLLEL